MHGIYAEFQYPWVGTPGQSCRTWECSFTLFIILSSTTNCPYNLSLSLDLDETGASPGNIPVNIGLRVEIGDNVRLTWGGVVKNCAEENGGDLSKCGDANEAIVKSLELMLEMFLL